VSKYQFAVSDIYLPGTDIPKNRLGITEPELLHEVEESLLQQAYQAFIAECEPNTRFDETYFKSLQQRTFETLYDWAGVYRTVDMSKGGSLFCRAAYLEQESKRIFHQLEECWATETKGRRGFDIFAAPFCAGVKSLPRN
jgi:cell filamentation protein